MIIFFFFQQQKHCCSFLCCAIARERVRARSKHQYHLGELRHGNRSLIYVLNTNASSDKYEKQQPTSFEPNEIGEWVSKRDGMKKVCISVAPVCKFHPYNHNWSRLLRRALGIFNSIYVCSSNNNTTHNVATCCFFSPVRARSEEITILTKAVSIENAKFNNTLLLTPCLIWLNYNRSSTQLYDTCRKEDEYLWVKYSKYCLSKEKRMFLKSIINSMTIEETFTFLVILVLIIHCSSDKKDIIFTFSIQFCFSFFYFYFTIYIGGFIDVNPEQKWQNLSCCFFFSLAFHYRFLHVQTTKNQHNWYIQLQRNE